MPFLVDARLVTSDCQPTDCDAHTAAAWCGQNCVDACLCRVQGDETMTWHFGLKLHMTEFRFCSSDVGSLVKGGDGCLLRSVSHHPTGGFFQGVVVYSLPFCRAQKRHGRRFSHRHLHHCQAQRKPVPEAPDPYIMRGPWLCASSLPEGRQRHVIDEFAREAL